MVGTADTEETEETKEWEESEETAESAGTAETARTVVVADAPASADRAARRLEATLPVTCLTASTPAEVVSLLSGGQVDCVVTELAFDGAPEPGPATDAGVDGDDGRSGVTGTDSDRFYRGASESVSVDVAAVEGDGPGRGSTADDEPGGAVAAEDDPAAADDDTVDAFDGDAVDAFDDGDRPDDRFRAGETLDETTGRAGIALVDAIRRRDPTLPVVVYTGRDLDTVVDGPVLAGATACVGKHDDGAAADLVEWVERAVSARTDAARGRDSDSHRLGERRDRLAGLAHDLKNPLQAANVYLSAAGDDCESPALADLAATHDRLLELVHDLDDLVTAGRAVRDREVVDVGHTAREAWRTVDTGDATLRDGASASVRGDARRVRRLLENLLANAVRHGGDDATVVVGDLADGTADADDIPDAAGTVDEAVGFYVADDGPGVPPGERDVVFERGYTTDDGGTGYGLAIVAELAAAHGWSVSVTESERGGARFEVRTD